MGNSGKIRLAGLSGDATAKQPQLTMIPSGAGIKTPLNYFKYLKYQSLVIRESSFAICRMPIMKIPPRTPTNTPTTKAIIGGLILGLPYVNI